MTYKQFLPMSRLRRLNLYKDFIDSKIREGLIYKPKSGLCRHHIVPVCFGRPRSFTKEPWNIVVLTIKDHLRAHRLLWLAYEDVDIYAGKMAHAFKRMLPCDTRLQDLIDDKSFELTLPEYEQLEKDFRQTSGMKGHKQSNYNSICVHNLMKDHKVVHKNNIVRYATSEDEYNQLKNIGYKDGTGRPANNKGKPSSLRGKKTERPSPNKNKPSPNKGGTNKSKGVPRPQSSGINNPAYGKHSNNFGKKVLYKDLIKIYVCPIDIERYLKDGFSVHAPKRILTKKEHDRRSKAAYKFWKKQHAAKK